MNVFMESALKNITEEENEEGRDEAENRKIFVLVSGVIRTVLSGNGSKKTGSLDKNI